MNPLTIGLAIGGIAMSAFGGFGAANKANQASQINQQIAADEQRINNQRRMQMELEGNRSQLQNMRNAQRLRAQATAAATNQGATFGSGLYGGLAEITGTENTNSTNINQNLGIGRNIFDINDDISAKKGQLAQVQGGMATDQAWSSLGGALVSNSGTIGNIFRGGFGGGSPGGNYRGTPGASNTGGLY